jgi:hypothetical protein
MSKCKNTNFDEWEITQLGENIPSWWMKQLDDCSRCFKDEFNFIHWKSSKVLFQPWISLEEYINFHAETCVDELQLSSWTK